MLIGEELGLGYEDVEQLRFAGLLHDVGKTGVPEEILLKPGRLTPEELLKAQSHAEIGASIIDQIDFLKSLTPIILHHHERWDGSGYPAALAGEDIPLLARVLAVADAFDAMTADTPYRAEDDDGASAGRGRGRGRDAVRPQGRRRPSRRCSTAWRLPDRQDCSCPRSCAAPPICRA